VKARLDFLQEKGARLTGTFRRPVRILVAWLDPAVEHAATRGYTGRDLSRMERQIRDHRDALIRRWVEACEGEPK
jgi:hypothetical protein